MLNEDYVLIEKLKLATNLSSKHDISFFAQIENFYIRILEKG